MLIVDAHLDLSMNAIEWNRDLTRPIEETGLTRGTDNDARRRSLPLI